MNFFKISHANLVLILLLTSACMSRCVIQSALLSSYHKVTKRANLRKPAASNGLYTLLCTGFYTNLLFTVSANMRIFSLIQIKTILIN